MNLTMARIEEGLSDDPPRAEEWADLRRHNRIQNYCGGARGGEMKSLADVQRQLAVGEFDFSRHAFRRAVERNISEAEIREAGASCVLVENYPGDKYSPSGLLLGFTAAGRPLHFQVSFADAPLAKIITIYEPDPNEWIDHRKRR